MPFYEISVNLISDDGAKIPFFYAVEPVDSPKITTILKGMIAFGVIPPD